MEKLFDIWCEKYEHKNANKRLWRMLEVKDTRDAVILELADRLQSYYVSDTEIAIFLEELDQSQLAQVINDHYPIGSKGRSGDLGEILATELIEECCEFIVPIRRFQYKDHREQAMRGEDVIGIRFTDKKKLELLKAEAKSAISLASGTVLEARSALDSHNGRPSPHALMFTARKLINSGIAEQKELGLAILLEAQTKEVPKVRITHLFFALTENLAGDMIDTDFAAADAGYNQLIAHVRISKHAEFINAVYDTAST